MALDRRERLEKILERENDKMAFHNKVEKNFTSAKLRDLRLSPTDLATGSVKMDKKSRVIPGLPPPDHSHGQTMTKTTGNRPTHSAKHASTIHGETSKPLFEAPNRRPTWAAVPTGLTDNAWIPKNLEETAPPGLPGKKKPKGEWTVLRQFENALSSVDQLTRKRMQEKEIVEHRAYLDHQLAEKEHGLSLAREQTKREAARLKTDLDKWNAEELYKKGVRKEKEEILKAQQTLQLEKLRRDRDSEVDRVRRQEEQAMDLAKRQIDSDRETVRQKKVEKASKMREDLKVMDQQIKLKAELKEHTRQEDIRLQKEYQELLDSQDKAREEVNAERTRKAVARAVAAGGNLQEEVQMRKAMEDERFRKHQEALDAVLAAREQAKLDKNEREKHEILDQLQDQLRRKEHQADLQKLEKERFSETMKAKDQLEREKDEAMRLARRQKNLAHKKELVQQMHIDRMKDKPDECMTQEEVLINAPLLTRAHEIMEEGSEYQ
mmetsp:Transcript_29421/g.49432  ORF Transcript_29421/g.49432 Transcript_29421/m.49432 type:complete len:493 (-) Transcript_29421:367-1845(-)|eukprot:CAMPEP_0198202314 /NCGR_PEP_ID=MMETSP1445-20131203/5445_1 /TAXON_ID=36898 /ORGANISM="Pyramimonas sp., Strain CCMP2087" /LENGTH=492 /DNA_ID=CAMNT_0043873165 /DNA_START=172 /DNA_END=1650 /DNA_ORIENTATION=-